MGFALQVASLIHLVDKPEADLSMLQLRTFVNKLLDARQLSEAGLKSDAGSVSGSRSHEGSQLGATRLSHPDTLAWMCQTLNRTVVKFQGVAERRLAVLQVVYDECLQMLRRIPIMTQETLYRQYLQKHKDTLAKHCQRLMDETKGFNDALQVIESLPEDVAVQAKSARDAILRMQRILDDATRLSHCLSFHVVWFASLTLFRSPSLGDTVSTGKSTAAKLLQLLGTILNQEWPRTPPHSLVDSEIFLQTCLDMAATATCQLLE